MLLFLISLFALAYSRKYAYKNDIFNHFPAPRDKLSATEGLTDEELSLQFTIAWETFLNPGVWLNEWDLQSNPSQASFDSLRYQLAFVTYSAASVCYQATPAYKQVCINTISNAIERMLSPVVWAKLVDEQWGPKSGGSCRDPKYHWAQAPTWPDPVIFQNIMYSGHVAQMMVLFESITGNNTYSNDGWVFNYNKTTSIPYNLTKLLDGLAIQQNNPNNLQGGIPCEPFQVFTECNEHQQIAFNQYSKAIKYNQDYENAKNKFAKYLVNECPKNYSKASPLEGWVQGIYAQDKAMYFVNDQGDGNWSADHWDCGYNGNHVGFSGLANVPPRDIWVAAMAFLYLNETDIDRFVCNDGLIILLDDRLWHYSPPDEYDGWVLRNNVDLGIGFGSAMYTIGAKQCLWFNEQAGQNITVIEDRINGTMRYLINKWGGNVVNTYNISAPLLYTKNDDNGFGAPIMDTANMLNGMVLQNDSFRQVQSNNWPELQTSLELLSVDYPNVMVRFAKVLEVGLLQFEIIVAVSKNIINNETEMIVKLDGNNNLKKITMNGNVLPQTEYSVKGDMLTINPKINVNEASVFQVITTTNNNL